MSWKLCCMSAIAVACIALPVNIIGCVEIPNSWDEYTSFFRNDLTPNKSLRPFYYIYDQQLYGFSENEKDNACADWVRYGRNKFSVDDAHQIVCFTAEEDLLTIYHNLQKNPAHPVIPLYLAHQPMIRQLVHTRDTAAIRYILFARQTEAYRQHDIPFTTPTTTPQQKTQDSLQTNHLIAEALTRTHQTRSPFIRARYAYLATSLSFYNLRYADCIHYLNTIVDTRSAGSLYPEALALTGGAAYHSNQKPLAAYLYSRAFALSGGTINTYRGFDWSVDRKDTATLDSTLALCKNARERADIIALNALRTTTPQEKNLRAIYRIAPTSPVLEVLVQREVNKIEQFYFSQQLKRKPGGLVMYFDGFDDEDPPSDKPYKAELRTLSTWLDSASRTSRPANPGLYATAAAYLYFIRHDLDGADALLNRAATLPANPKLRSQQKLTRLLITINKYRRIDAEAERALLPSIQWLEKMAHADGPPITTPLDWYFKPGLGAQFYRNLLAEVLAKRYAQQGDSAREALCIGAAETVFNSLDSDYHWPETLMHIQRLFSSKDLGRLYQTIHQRHPSPFERYLIKRFPLTEDTLVQALATANIREHHWDQALYWLGKVKNERWLYLDRDPFGDMILDHSWQFLPADYTFHDKPGFIHRMKELTDKERQGKANAQELYQLALGYYSMASNGRIHSIVNYYVAPWNTEIEPPDGKFKRDFADGYTAIQYALKAKKASTDKNFQARCLFLAAKCDVGWMDENPYFPELVRDYAHTPYYSEVFNTCSYLRDFVNKTH